MSLTHRLNIPGHVPAGPEVQRHRPARKPVAITERAPVTAADRLFELNQLVARQEQGARDRNPKRAHRLKFEHTKGKLLVNLELLEGPSWIFSGNYFTVTKCPGVTRAARLGVFCTIKAAGTFPEQLTRFTGVGELQLLAAMIFDMVQGQEFEA